MLDFRLLNWMSDADNAEADFREFTERLDLADTHFRLILFASISTPTIALVAASGGY